MKILGLFLISLSVILSIYCMASYIRYIYTKEKFYLNRGGKAHSFLLYTLILVGLLLFYGIITHDFSLNYVASYSSMKEEWYYLISTFWAGQEGTFYLWLLYTVLFGQIIIKQKHVYVPYVLVILHVTIFFLLIILVKQSPFRPLAPEILSVLVDGRGLNPLLKNPWMVIHPPILFLGYSSVVVPAAFAIAGLWKRDVRGWMEYAFPWILFTTAILGLGVIMGGYWAYVVLGWGGYWAWDPVENASIFPWFLLVACFHSILIFRSVKGFLKTSIILPIAAYFMMLYGSFLTRSGVLEKFSVHSFSSLGLNTELIAFIVVFTGIGLYFFISRWGTLSCRKIEDKFSKDMVLAFVVVLFILSTIGIFIGTSLPLFTIFSEAQLASAPPERYNEVFSYVAIFTMAFLGIGPVLKWKGNGFQIKKRFLLITAFCSLVIIFFVFLLKYDLSGKYYLVFGLAAWACFINGYNFFRFYKSPPLRASALTHLGLGLMILGIMSSNTLGTDKRIRLYKNQKQVVGNKLNLTFTKKEQDEKNPDVSKYYVKGDFGTNNPFTAVLKFTYSSYNNGIMREPHIERTPYADYYFSPVNLTEFPNQKRMILKEGESFSWEDKIIKFKGFSVLEMNSQKNVFDVLANFDITYQDSTYQISGRYLKTSALIRADISVLKDADYSFKILDLNATKKSVHVVYGKANDPLILEQLEVELSTKPFIYTLWLGTILLVLGLLFSVRYRITQVKIERIET